MRSDDFQSQPLETEDATVVAEICRILETFEKKMIPDKDIVAIFEKNPPPYQHELLWYRTLAAHFKSRNKHDTAAWFLAKLPNSTFDLTRMEEVLTSDGSRTALETVYVEAKEMLSVQHMPQFLNTKGRLKLRRQLRASLTKLFTGKFPDTDIDLIFVDANHSAFHKHALAETPWGSLDYILNSNEVTRIEVLDSEHLVILWCVKNTIFYLTKDEAFQCSRSAAIEAAASVCHHIGFPSTNPTLQDNFHETNPTPQALTRSYLGDPVIDAETILESRAISHFPLFGQIMKHIFQVKEFDSDQVKGMLQTVAEGGKDLAISGLNSPQAYQNMIGLYCFTNGYANDFLSWLIGLYSQPYTLPSMRGALGFLEKSAVEECIDVLRDRGYYVFPECLSQEKCDALVEFALHSEAQLISEVQASTQKGIYDRDNPKAHKYIFPEDALLQLPEVQKLICDPSIITISQAYLGAKPNLCSVSMWWNTAFSKIPSSAAAQLYHFDMDRIKWIKWFIYLTDVTTDTGPHSLIAKSHRRGGKPSELLKHGYTRLADKDVQQHYPTEDCIEVLGKRGTIIAADTRTFHKGKLPAKHDRLIFEFEFANSLFGAEFDLDCSFPPTVESSFNTAAIQFPHIYRRYNLLRNP